MLRKFAVSAKRNLSTKKQNKNRNLGAVAPQLPVRVPEVVACREADQPVRELAKDGECEADFVAG